MQTRQGRMAAERGQTKGQGSWRQGMGARSRADGEDGKGHEKPAELEDKIGVCEDILSVLSIVYPGLSKYRGLLLHELSETILIRASKLFNMENLSKEKFSSDLEKICSLLVEGIHCLDRDREGSVESQVCANMRKMQSTTEDFKKFISFL